MSAQTEGRRLEGKVALITGGARGIGETAARLFVKHGAKVLIADIQDELGHSVCQELQTPGRINYVHCDVTSESDVQHAVDLAVSLYGKLDIMFNNAGICGSSNTIFDSNNETFKKVMEVVAFGGYLGAKHAARVMVPAKKGCILFTASSVTECFGFGMHEYVMAKCAIVGFAKNLAVELGQYGIRVNCISPFAVATPLMTERFGLTKEKAEEVIGSSATLKETALEPEDIAQTALYLASDESKYVSGINLVVDGGYGLTNPTFPMAIKSILFP
ncbi:hypothetical protein SLE2022_079940 [Rubroshorea leprosula]